MSETKYQKRPASHRWAIGVFGFMTAAFVIFLVDLLRGRDGVTPGPYWSQILVFTVFALILVSLVLGGRRRWAYYTCSGALVSLCVRGTYAGLWRLYHSVVRGDSVSTPYFHLTERDQPFVVQHHVPIGHQLLMAGMMGLLIWLFIRFTFGRPSRSYYGFDEERKPIVDNGRREASTPDPTLPPL